MVHPDPAEADWRRTMNDRLAYTVAEACGALRIGRTTLYKLFNQGKLKPVALGGKTLVLASEVDRFLSELPQIPLQQENDNSNSVVSK